MEQMTFSIPACMIDAQGPQQAVTRAIEEILQDGAEALVGCLSVAIYPADVREKPFVIPLPLNLRQWLDIAAEDQDDMQAIEFTLPIPARYLWQGSGMPLVGVATAESLKVAA